VAGTVAQADLAPTLLDLAGLKSEGLDGVSLREALAGAGSAAGHPVYSETFYPRYHLGWSELFAATDGRYRYVRAPRPELFDLSSDKAEQRNLAGERTNVAGSPKWIPLMWAALHVVKASVSLSFARYTIQMTSPVAASRK